MYRRRTSSSSGGRGCLSNGRILIAVAVAIFSLISYFGSQQFNPVTQEDQYIAMTQEQEIALGLQSAPQMEQEFGGEDPDQEAQQFLDEVGFRIVEANNLDETGYPFEFTLLDDEETINAFALPGGPMYITAALFDQLETEEQLAGVMAHELVHVVARHSAEQLAQTQLTQGLAGAAVIAAYDPNNPRSRQTAQVAALVAGVINMKFGRDDELQSDELGVCFMANAGYDPEAMVAVMEVLAAGGPANRPPEFFSTHPNPDNRIENIREAIANYPEGCPQETVE